MWGLEKGNAEKFPVTAGLSIIALYVVCGTIMYIFYYLKPSAAVCYPHSQWCAGQWTTSPEAKGNQQKRKPCKSHPIQSHPKFRGVRLHPPRAAPGPRGHAPRGGLTCALLLHSAHALEPLEHSSQVGDAVLESDLLVLVRVCILQQLPHVHLRFFLLLLHLPNRGEPLPNLVAAHWILKHKAGWYRFFGSVLKTVQKKAWVLKVEREVSLLSLKPRRNLRIVNGQTLALNILFFPSQKHSIRGERKDIRKYSEGILLIFNLKV